MSRNLDSSPRFRDVLISHRASLKSFCKSQSPQKIVILSFIIADIYIYMGGRGTEAEHLELELGDVPRGNLLICIICIHIHIYIYIYI